MSIPKTIDVSNMPRDKKDLEGRYAKVEGKAIYRASCARFKFIPEKKQWILYTNSAKKPLALKNGSLLGWWQVKKKSFLVATATPMALDKLVMRTLFLLAIILLINLLPIY